jgi:hypothetical protein
MTVRPPQTWCGLVIGHTVATHESVRVDPVGTTLVGAVIEHYEFVILGVAQTERVEEGDDEYN